MEIKTVIQQVKGSRNALVRTIAYVGFTLDDLNKINKIGGCNFLDIDRIFFKDKSALRQFQKLLRIKDQKVSCKILTKEVKYNDGDR